MAKTFLAELSPSLNQTRGDDSNDDSDHDEVENVDAL